MPPPPFSLSPPPSLPLPPPSPPLSLLHPPPLPPLPPPPPLSPSFPSPSLLSPSLALTFSPSLSRYSTDTAPPPASFISRIGYSFKKNTLLGSAPRLRSHREGGRRREGCGSREGRQREGEGEEEEVERAGDSAKVYSYRHMDVSRLCVLCTTRSHWLAHMLTSQIHTDRKSVV